MTAGKERFRKKAATIPQFTMMIAIVAGTMIAAPLVAQSITDRAQVSRSPTSTSIEITEGRPTFIALRVISQEFGWIVDYEETAYASEDTSKVVPHSGRLAGPAEQGTLVPKEESISFTVSWQAPLTEAKDKLRVTQALLDTANHNRLRRTSISKQAPDGRVYVIDADANSTSVGDVVITPASGTMDGLTAFSSVLELCSKMAGKTINLGTVPINLLSQTKVTFTAGQMSCRQAVETILDHSRYKLTYSLLADPEGGALVWNVEPATKTLVLASGETRQQTMENTPPK